MTEFSLTLDTRELRAALVSVLPHVMQDPDLPTLCRIRVYVVPEGLVLASTDRFTGALARVQVEDSGGELGFFDVTPLDAREVLQLFKPLKDIPHTVRLEHDGKQFRVTDVSGLFPGKSVTFEGFAADEKFPDIANLIGLSIRAIGPSVNDLGATVVGVGRLAEALRHRPWRSGYSIAALSMAKFSAAGKAYGMPLSVEPTTALPPALLVTCGEDFAGLLIPGRRDEDQEVYFADVRTSWSDLARSVTLAHPIQPEVRRERDARSVVDLSDLLEPPADDEPEPEAGDES